MVEKKPNFDFEDIEEKPGFPWLGLFGVIAVLALGAIWIVYGKSHHGGGTASAALEQQLDADKVALDAERQKVFDMTAQLDVLKQQVASASGAEKAKAVAAYNQLAADQRAQREKAKTLSDQYNQKVAKLQELKLGS